MMQPRSTPFILFGLTILLVSIACSLPFLSQPTPTATMPPSATPPAAHSDLPRPYPPRPRRPPCCRRHGWKPATGRCSLAIMLPALAAYSAALSASSDPEIQAAGLVGQGRIYLLTGRIPEALDALRAAAVGYPNTTHAPAANYFLAQVYTELDRYGEAAQAYDTYRTLRPGVLDAFISERRGDVLLAAGDRAGALAEYLLALQAPRLLEDFSLEFKLAQAYTASGDYATALVMYGDIYNRTGSDYERAQADYLKGQILIAQGQTDAALQPTWTR